MYAEERQQVIAAQAREQGRVEVVRLADELAVTPETIRRDLSRLERRGVLKRVHGGAIPLDRIGFEPAVEDRGQRMVAEKERIAKRALAELPAEGSILLDAGTTTAQVAKALPQDRELTVVTNALDIAVDLANRPNVTLLTIGGRVRSRTLAAVDTWASSVLDELYVDVAFIATNGVSVERGLTTPDAGEAGTKRTMVRAARRVVLLADHTKLGNDNLVRFAEISDIDTLITDSGADGRLISQIEQADVEVIRA
ncbi:DeoR/GlpR family DNA-binding transcription regulator [Euzebya tangerina]|uniref:DeoR/GlpR family DNA-binding transcription regulator n=1 Tax=Euzebya tangerina TaxID=591198 RepID=UPI000E320F25|nr:DeoR/GlpR family DNA-binding transcription regulator [Euzebya tangerina]